MKFRTELSPAQSDFNITYKDKLVFLGSCFADHMFAYFHKYKFDSLSNPFGTLYHPVSISKAIHVALSSSEYSGSVFTINNLWTSFDVHSSLNKLTKEEFIQNVEIQKNTLREGLINAQVLFITLGTAHAYRHLNSNEIVANCHKISQQEFRKELLPLEAIEESLNACIESVYDLNPNLKVILTLSPVRYLRDGFEENQLSKSLLYVAINKCVSSYTHVSYFPSYEYVLDDLRDYRYFDRDLVHPNHAALDYLWEKLMATYFTENTKAILKQVEKINNRLNHKLFFPKSTMAETFEQKTKQLINSLHLEYPDFDFRF